MCLVLSWDLSSFEGLSVVIALFDTGGGAILVVRWLACSTLDRQVVNSTRYSTQGISQHAVPVCWVYVTLTSGQQANQNPSGPPHPPLLFLTTWPLSSPGALTCGRAEHIRRSPRRSIPPRQMTCHFGIIGVSPAYNTHIKPVTAGRSNIKRCIGWSIRFPRSFRLFGMAFVTEIH